MRGGRDLSLGLDGDGLGNAADDKLGAGELLRLGKVPGGGGGCVCVSLEELVLERRDQVC